MGCFAPRSCPARTSTIITRVPGGSMSEAMRDDNRSPPFRVVIVGGGTAGWMSAAGIRRQVGTDDYSVTLIESDEIGTVGVGEATLPHIKTFNDMLGVDEAQFMRETRATFKLGIQFRDWDQPGEGYIHPFELPNEDRKSIRSTYTYAYHFDASLYAAYLRSLATQRGVHRIEGQVCDVRRNPTTGDIAELTLKSGERIVGDLFIDCSGFRSLLLGGVMGVAWGGWTHWLPCDRALAVPCKRVGPLTPYTRATARRGGWTWRIPLQHRTGNGYVFSSRFINDGEAQDALLAGLDGAAQGEPRLLRFSPGPRDRPWQGNCVAIGLASGFLEPLESTSIYLIQAAVTDLINLMPRPGSTGTDPRLVDEFNRLNEMQYERIRDFLVLHYTANGRVGEPLWDYARSMPLPDSLVHKLQLFRSRAALPSHQYGLFARDSWLAVLVGQGIVATGYDRLADAFPLSALEERLSEFRNRIQTNVDGMTAHDAFIANYAEAMEIKKSAEAVA